MTKQTSEDDEEITVKDVIRAFVFGIILVSISLVNGDLVLLGLMAGFIGIIFVDMFFMENEPTQTTLEDFDSSE